MNLKFIQLLNKDINKTSRFFLITSFSLMIVMILFLTTYIFIPPFISNNTLYINFFNIDLVNNTAVDINTKYLNFIGILTTILISIIIPMSGYGYWKYKKSDYLAVYNSNHISAFMIIGNLFLLLLFIIAFINRPSSVVYNNPWINEVSDIIFEPNILYKDGVFINLSMAEKIGTWEFSFIFSYNFNRGNSASIAYTWWDLRIAAQILIFYVALFYLGLIITAASIIYTNNLLIEKSEIFNISEG